MTFSCSLSEVMALIHTVNYIEMICVSNGASISEDLSKALPYWRGSRQSEVPSSTVAFWQMFQMLKYIKTGMEVKPVTPSQASMKMYVSIMNYRKSTGYIYGTF